VLCCAALVSGGAWRFARHEFIGTGHGDDFATNRTARSAMKTKIQLVALLAIAALAAVFAQGPLTPPPGNPAPLMKTLDQVEPKIPINDLTAPGDQSKHHIISQPGSYYLTANLGVTRNHGISIAAAGVTVDLMGFEIKRTAFTGGVAILLEDNSHRCTVRNGSVSSPAGSFVDGVAGNFAENVSIIDLAVSNCAGEGIYAPRGALLERCRVYQNAGGGIYARLGGTLIHCVAYKNTGSGIMTESGCTLIDCSAISTSDAGAGIRTGDGCTLSNCTAMANTHSFASSYGIFTGPNCTVTGCTSSGNSTSHDPAGMDTGGGISAGPGTTLRDCAVQSNAGTGTKVGNNCTISNCTTSDNNFYGLYTDAGCTVTDCTAKGTTGSGIGIRAGDNSTVNGCTASDNDGDGIQLTAGCHASRNNASGNTGNGIHAFGSLNRIDGNHATRNTGAGIRSEAADFTVRNTVNSNAGGSLVPGPAAGTNVAPIQQAFSATNPWANLQ
jgi:parallel beta-helix repeat protein